MNIFKLAKSTINRVRLDFALKKRFPELTLERNVIIKGNLDNLTIKGKALIQSGSVIHLGGMDWCENKGCLEVGGNAVISPNCVIYAAGPGGVRIGNNFDCGPGVCVFSSRTHYQKGPNSHVFAPVVIGNNVTLFANSVIDIGVTIGNGAVIAACSVVVDDVPDNTLVGGAPARIIASDIKRV